MVAIGAYRSDPLKEGTTTCTDKHWHNHNPIFYYTITGDGLPDPIVEKNEKPYFRKFEKKRRV